MSEEEFISLIDCRFPFDDVARSEELVHVACGICPNCVFMILYEIICTKNSNAPQILEFIQKTFDHAMKDRIIKIVQRYRQGDHLSEAEALQEIEFSLNSRAGFNALNIIAYSSESDLVFRRIEIIQGTREN